MMMGTGVEKHSETDTADYYCGRAGFGLGCKLFGGFIAVGSKVFGGKTDKHSGKQSRKDFEK